MALVSRARGTFYGQRTGGAPHRRAVFIGFGPLAGGAAGARERSLKSSHFVAPLSRLNFGLGKSDHADSIEIRWPDGQVEKFKDVRGDRFVVYMHPANATPRASAKRSPRTSLNFS